MVDDDEWETVEQYESSDDRNMSMDSSSTGSLSSKVSTMK